MTDMDRARLEVAPWRIAVVLERVEEGMTTAADADFLRELLGLNAKKVVPKREKGSFSEKSAR